MSCSSNNYEKDKFTINVGFENISMKTAEKIYCQVSSKTHFKITYPTHSQILKYLTPMSKRGFYCTAHIKMDDFRLHKIQIILKWRNSTNLFFKFHTLKENYSILRMDRSRIIFKKLT